MDWYGGMGRGEWGCFGMSVVVLYVIGVHDGGVMEYSVCVDIV